MPLLTPRALWLLASAGLWLLLAGWWAPSEVLFAAHVLIVVATIMFDALQITRGLGALTIRRQMPSQIGLGEPEAITYHWTHSAAVPLSIELKESSVHPFPTITPWPLTWVVQPTSDGQIALTVTPAVRGQLTFPEIRIRATSPMNLVCWQQKRKLPESTTVVPGMRALRDLRLWARREDIPLGSTRLPRREEGTQFKELRPYVPGDSMKSIDWKATARRGSLIVRELEPERAQSLMLVLDCGRSMRVTVEGMQRLDAALAAALALSWVAISRSDLVGAAAFGHKLHTFMPPRSGNGQMKLLMEQLGTLQAEGIEPDYRAQLATIASMIRKRTLVVVFTEVASRELSRDLIAGIRMLARRHLPVVVTLPDARLEALLDKAPTDPDMLFHQAAAAEVLNERAGALQAITEAGGIVVDVPPGRLSAAVVNAYIRIKMRGRL